MPGRERRGSGAEKIARTPSGPEESTTGGPRPERADAAANRIRILDAAARVLAEQGGEQTPIDAVAREAGVGKGTVFRRFGDRHGLYRALHGALDERLRAFQDASTYGPPPLGPGASPQDRLAAFFDGLLDLYDDHLELALAVTKVCPVGMLASHQALLRHAEMLIEEMGPEVDAPVAAQLLLGAISVELVGTLRRDGGVSLTRIKASARRLIAGLDGEAP